MTMAMLAGGMNIPPSSITFHCDRLVAARLIARERRGREVWIDRTPPGGGAARALPPLDEGHVWGGRPTG
ncbi:MarR family winged helix-turn-helix transcriptional regulator [Nonomuraea sp. NPDC049695]|uniref:MarR family winged helix-turn-helix transcriptional regulator n=1 Tax=Nonomuraea sp. NPDC049695 TaxID=3154734 RepID=UPI00342D1FC1